MPRLALNAIEVPPPEVGGATVDMWAAGQALPRPDVAVVGYAPSAAAVMCACARWPNRLNAQ